MQQIQGTKFEKQCFETPSTKFIAIYPQGSLNSIAEVQKQNKSLPEIEFDGEKCDASRARQMAQALQLAATIANDFDTWFDG